MKAKFNAMDVFLLLLLAAVLVVGGWFLTHRNRAQGMVQNKTVEAMIELTQQDEAFTKLPQIGDTVVLGEKEKMPATVTKVEVLPAVSQGKNLIDGRYTEAEIPGLYHVRISVMGAGTESPAAVEINGNALRVGMAAAIKSKNWAGYGFILSVDTTN